MKYCCKCGNKIPKELRFCNECGFDFNELKEAEEEKESFWPPIILCIGIFLTLLVCAIVFNIIF
ncbi:MAG: hypothetical protein R3Y05_05620 [bacterium]